MGRRLKGGAALLVLGLGALGSALVIAPGTASAGTPIPPPTGAVVVGVAGTYCPSPAYSTIQSAINAVSAGATIYVCSGTYGESLTIDKPVTLDGAQYSVDARSRDGTNETVIDASAGIVYGAGATGGTLSGFTLTGYSGTSGVVQALGTGSGWTFTDDVVDVSGGGIALDTDGVANPVASLVKNDLFEQATPSAATTGDAGEAVMITGGAANNVQITGDTFQELSGPGAAITTPGTAACGATLDSTNFSENLLVRNDAMSENGASFTDPVNGPGYVDEPFVDLQCTNAAQIFDDN
ncbi:MAG: hypothetical protein KGJ77_06820, partial [Acidobacteriota bacterium]|nr:hypothetical protein [Acidobacteriota bacterium]